MESNEKENSPEILIYKRRDFIEKSLKITLVTGIAGAGFLAGCRDKPEAKNEDKEKKEDDEKEVSPPEDLMQEHGLLNRVLLIYDNFSRHIIYKEKFQPEILLHSAEIIRTFVEDYHEKQEENYLFPRFEKANQLTDLVSTLRIQHDAGRKITDGILHFGKMKTLNESDNIKLLKLLTDFNFMYRPHEAREDTILFPAFRKLVSKHEYDSLGEEFENNEHKQFGEDGFEKMVDKVSELEKQLVIYELSQFTPKD